MLFFEKYGDSINDIFAKGFILIDLELGAPAGWYHARAPFTFTYMKSVAVWNHPTFCRCCMRDKAYPFNIQGFFPVWYIDVAP